MADTAQFIVRYLRQGTRRVAYVRDSDVPNGWLRVPMKMAKKMLSDGRAIEDDRGGRPA